MQLLRTMLLKKINPQTTPRASSMKRYIEDKRISKMEKQDEKGKKTGDGSKWVKTDSECKFIFSSHIYDTILIYQN